MNIKKYLQKQADKDAESLLTESDRQFCMQLAEEAQVTERPSYIKSKTKTWAGLGSLAAVVLAAVIIVPIAVRKKPVDEILYLTEPLQEDCTVEDVNSNSKYFYIEEQQNLTYAPVLKYDSVSNDKLFYSINVFTGISDFTIDIVVNEKYNYESELSEELLIYPAQSYIINYEKKENYGLANGEVRYIGYIQLNSETVYIEYKQLIDLEELGDQVFFEDIQSVLKVKN